MRAFPLRSKNPLREREKEREKKGKAAAPRHSFVLGNRLNRSKDWNDASRFSRVFPRRLFLKANFMI